LFTSGAETAQLVCPDRRQPLAELTANHEFLSLGADGRVVARDQHTRANSLALGAFNAPRAFQPIPVPGVRGVRVGALSGVTLVLDISNLFS
jgi:hypothetical protein